MKWRSAGRDADVPRDGCSFGVGSGLAGFRLGFFGCSGGLVAFGADFSAFAANLAEIVAAVALPNGLASLTADVDPLNGACLALLTSAGFEETGRELATYTVGSRVCDSVYLRLDLPAR